MNAYETLQRKDTFLNGSLLAVAIAWVMLAAVQSPVASATPAAGANYASSHSAPVHAARSTAPARA
jgi:hypothetical protein